MADDAQPRTNITGLRCLIWVATMKINTEGFWRFLAEATQTDLCMSLSNGWS